MVSAYGSGEYASGQSHVLVTGRLGKTRRGIIWCGGAGSTELDVITPPVIPTAVNAVAMFAPIAHRGHAITSWNAQWTWLNDVAQNRMDRLYDWLVTSKGYESRVILMGGSQGAGTCFQWAKRWPERVQAIAGLMPLTHAKAFLDENRGGHAESILKAWGGLDAFKSAMRTKDPIAFAADLSSVPIHCWRSPDDPLIPGEETEAFASASGAGLTTLPAGGGHSISKLDVDQMLDFLQVHG